MLPDSHPYTVKIPSVA